MNITSELKIVAKIFFCTVLLLILFIAVLAVHENIWKSDIIFYGYIKILLIFFVVATAVMVIMFLYVPIFKKILPLSAVLLSNIIFLLVSYAFIITFPVTLDRSFSIYLLGALNKCETPIQKEKLISIVSKYFHDPKLVEKRIYEQLATGSIISNDGGETIYMTANGKRIVIVNKIIGKMFNIGKENIDPAISEE